MVNKKSHTNMLQAILDGQNALKEELKDDIGKVKGEVDNVRKDVKRVEKKVDKNGERLDKLGKQLAYLEDDAPTIEEFDDHEERLAKVEKQVASG